MNTPMSNAMRARRAGFSLVELTAVLALMAILASVVTLSVRPIMTKGKQNAARAEIGNICSALETFNTLYGRYPTNDEGLAILTQKTDKLPEGLLKEVPSDPWGHPYQYNVPGQESQPYEVICFGADGKEGGDGADADISSEHLKDSTLKSAASATP
jgi:general secretion pathway protein G